MTDVTRHEPLEFDGAAGEGVAFCPFCCAATVAESEACGVEETRWDVRRQCSHFVRFDQMRAVFMGPEDMLEGVE